ncbi:unnamed protein product, partial [Polarella glacialis]
NAQSFIPHTRVVDGCASDAGASIASAEESLEALEARVLAKLRQRPGIWEQVPASALSPAHARPAVASSARCEQSLATPGSLLQEAEALNQSISFEDYPGEDWAAVGRPFSFGDLAGSGEQETPLGASALENSPPPLWSRPPAWTVLPKRRIEEMLKAVTTQITLRWRSAQSYEVRRSCFDYLWCQALLLLLAASVAASGVPFLSHEAASSGSFALLWAKIGSAEYALAVDSRSSRRAAVTCGKSQERSASIDKQTT